MRNVLIERALQRMAKEKSQMTKTRILTILLVLGMTLGWMLPVLADGEPLLPEIRGNTTINTSLKRAYDWDVTKSADQATLTLAVGEQALVNYTVTVNANTVDSNWAADGYFDVFNATDAPITVISASDIVSPDIEAAVQCGSAFPFTVPAGWAKRCTYNVSLPDGASRTNTAMATVEMDDGSTLDISRSLDFDFSDAVLTEETDACVEVYDNQVGSLGTVCEDNMFNYAQVIGPFDACGEYTIENVASFTTNDTATTGSASWTVTVNVPCDGGNNCTLTPGYWKTHSEYGPAPYDATWAELPDGADTPFFDTGKSWHQALWTPPRGGNAYYILSHAYIAAYLNGLNGADTTVISDEMAQAESLLDQYDGDPEPMRKIRGRTRRQFIRLALVLDRYNRGRIGPGHCRPD
jgi:hypothetical protein